MPARLIDVSIVGTDEVALRVTRVGSASRMRLKRGIEDAQRLLLNNIKVDQLSGSPGLNVRSGTLRRSGMIHPVEETGNRMQGSVGFNTVYARIQDIGGTVSASEKKLTIPFDAVLTARGIPRYSAADVIQDPGIGGFDRVIFLANILYGVVDGTYTYVATKRPAKSITPLFHLRESVTIKPARYMEKGLEESRDAIVERLEAALAEAVRE